MNVSRELGARVRLIAAAVLSVTAAVSAAALLPAQSAAAANRAPIVGSGSTWSANAINNWVAQVQTNGINVTYTGVGSTTGRQQFAQGTTNFGASEIPYGVQDGINRDPPPNRGFAYMPDTAGGTTFMYNLKIGTQRVTTLRLSDAAVAAIFTNKVQFWDDHIIAQDNPALHLPHIPVIPVVRSDGSGATAEFTQWMLATQPSYWHAFCAVVGRNPCTQTSAYPIQSGTTEKGQQGDTGVSGFIAQDSSNGTIGYVEYSYAKLTGFPVAKVLNAAGYFTEPTAGHVAVSLLKAKINTDQGNPNVYLTQDLSQVYTDTDPRTYELSSYSYLILPTDTKFGLSSDQGYTLGLFGSYLLCEGQQIVDNLGYSALPINLVLAGYQQLRKIPGSQVAASDTTTVQQCHNPTFSTNGTNTLAQTDPMPSACDKQGATQCNTPTGGAGGGGGGNNNGGGGSNGGGSNNGTGNNGTSTGGTNGNGATGGTGGTNGTGASGGTGGATSGTSPSATQSCDPNTGICSGGTSTGGNGTGVAGLTGSNGQGGGQVNAIPVSSPSGLGDGPQIAVMALAAALLVGLCVVPPLVANSNASRRRRRGYDLPDDDYRGGGR